MSEASKCFDRALRAVVLERLRDHGFTFDKKRTFRRPGPDATIMHIIDFQLGLRYLQGKFTVNLGVYVEGDAQKHTPGLQPWDVREFHCAWQRRERLGRLLPRRIKVFDRVPILGMLFGPKDRWWSFSSDSTHTEAELSSALAALETYGLPWLDSMTPTPPHEREESNRVPENRR